MEVNHSGKENVGPSSHKGWRSEVDQKEECTNEGVSTQRWNNYYGLPKEHNQLP